MGPRLSIKKKVRDMAAREDFRQRLTRTLVQSMEEHDGMPWEQGWENAAARPFNPASGVKYKGGNVMGLLLAQLARGSNDPRWMTLKQANKAGYSIRKGAKASYVEYWDWGVPELNKVKVGKGGEHDQDDENEEQLRARRKARVFYAAVFNGEDIVGLPELISEQSWEPNELAEKLIAASGAEIEHTVVSRAGFGVVENAAYYSHATNKIVVPPKGSFKSQGDYYATVLHELAHWTGHSSRLGRRAPNEKVKFGSESYAREELRAEIAAFYLTSMLGVQGKVQNHARYTHHWLEVLKGDKHEIFRAARDAEQIVDHVFGYAPELREIVESAMAVNVLPEERAARKLDTGVSNDMPSFIPADAKPVVPVVRTGRDDPRWADFEKTLRETADRSGVVLNDESLAEVFQMMEPTFTQVMDSTTGRGMDEDVVYRMLSTRIVDEMKQVDLYQHTWNEFAERVRNASGAIPVEQVELALQTLNERYQQTMVSAANSRWDDARTADALNTVLYESGQAIDTAFVQRLVDASPAATLGDTGLDEDLDDEDVLSPLGMADVLTEDVGVMDDERIMRPGL